MENKKNNKRNKDIRIDKSKNKIKNKSNIDYKTKNKEKKKMKTWKKVLLVIFLILLICAGIFTYKVYKNGWGLGGMIATVVGNDNYTKKDLGEIKVLLLGISTDQENVELTDTIMVASYNPNTQKATLLSIPRDTYTGKNSAKATAYEKINALYSRKSRPDETLEAVNELTGLDIQYYVVVKTEGLIKLVDIIGGVTFDVPINMDYDDSSQDLHIHLKAGEQLLNGDKAEQLVRFRHNNNFTSYPEEYGDNDTGRMRTQREFIIQTLKQTLKPGNIFKLGQILDAANENVLTNIDFNVAKDYLPYAVEFNTDNILTAVLPGVNTNKNASGTWVFVCDKKATKELVQELFVNRDIEEGQEEGEDTNANINKSNESGSAISKSSIKIEVLNGSGESKKLQEAVNDIEGAGFKVTRTGSTNATAKTTIVDKKGLANSLLTNIKDALGAGTISQSQSDSSKVDVTIIVGKDY